VISSDLGSWHIPTLVIAGDGDEIAASARRAASEIPGGRFISLPNTNHLSALNDLHTVLPEIERLLRG
jgi:pimeloyl-ACP methyl ester carboxylesterase